MRAEELSACHNYLGDLPTSLFAQPTVLERLRHWAECRGSERWLVAVQKDGRESSLTFDELFRASQQFGSWLTRDCGIEAGNIVALMPHNDLVSVVAIFGILQAGCEVFFINPADPDARVVEFVSAIPVRLLLSQAPPPLPRTRSAVLPVLDNLARYGGSAQGRSNAEGAFYFSTSGSTATSKIVHQAHFNLIANAEALLRHHRLGPGERLLGCLPIHHVNGLHFTLMATLWSGAEAVLLEAFEPELYRECLRRYKPTIASVVPSVIEKLIFSGESLPFSHNFRYFVSAAAPLARETARVVADRFGVRVLQGYGLSETTNFSCKMPNGLPDAIYRKHALEPEIPSIGVALFGNEIAILRPDGRPVALGETGEICVRGHNVMFGYAGNADATSEAFRDGWFHSGDLGAAALDQQTGLTFFTITGRLKNIAKVMGISVSLEELERALSKHPEVADAACYTETDQLLGEAIVGIVQPRSAITATTLDSYLSQRFVREMRPVRYVFVESVPRTATGKLIRRELQQRYSAVPDLACPTG